MKYLNFIVVAALAIFVFASCEKESTTETTDNVPVLEPVTEVVVDNNPPSYARIANSGQSALARFVFDSTTMEVNNYSLVLPSNLIGAPDVVFASTWLPAASTETEIQAITYTIDDVETISQAGIDAWDAWVANGSDPNTMPDLFSPNSPFVTRYTATLTYDISNITATTADVTVSGSIVDSSGNSTPLSATITADRYY